NRQGGEDISRAHGKVELRTSGDVLLDLVNRVIEHDVASCACHRVQGLHQWHTGGKGGGQGTCITSNRGFVDDLAYHRSLEQGTVLRIPERLGASIEVLIRPANHNDGYQQYEPPGLQPL